jgi:hypothetical protein
MRDIHGVEIKCGDRIYIDDGMWCRSDPDAFNKRWVGIVVQQDGYRVTVFKMLFSSLRFDTLFSTFAGSHLEIMPDEDVEYIKQLIVARALIS